MAKPILHMSKGRRPQPSAASDPRPPVERLPQSTVLGDGAASLRPEDRRALIARAAYFRAERRGFAAGHELEDWLAAERDLELLLPHEEMSSTGQG